MTKQIFNVCVLYGALALAGMTNGCVQYNKFEITEKPYVDKTSVELYVGEGAGERNYIQLKSSPADRQYTWTSLDPSIATVTQTGLVTAVAEGFADVVVSSDNDQTVVNVWVRNWVPLEDIQIIGSDQIVAYRNDRIQIFTAPIPLNASECNITWTSSNPEKLSVFENGWIVCNEAGSFIVTAKAGEVEKQIQVRVLKEWVSVLMDKSGWSIVGGVDYNSNDGAIGYSAQAWNDGTTTRTDAYVDYIFDGDRSTSWTTPWWSPYTEQPHWVIVDLGEEVVLTSVTMYRNDAVNMECGHTGFELLTCTEANAANNPADPTTWIWESQGEFPFAATVPNEQKYPLSAFPMARYIKLYVDTKFSSNVWAGVSIVMLTEMDVYIGV